MSPLVLFPEGEEGDLEFVLNAGQSAQLLGDVPVDVDEAIAKALDAYRAAVASPCATAPQTPS